MAEMLVHWATPKPREPEPEEPAFENELAYLEFVWRDPTKPDRLRYMAAKACADFHFPTLRAIAQVSRNDVASAIEAARARAALVANVIQMKIVPKALPPGQHSPDELKPNPARSAEANGSGGFRRRI
jgi:hypothetical protein